jgi:hypothetical protein
MAPSERHYHYLARFCVAANVEEDQTRKTFSTSSP